MPKINISRLWWVCLIAIAASYPLSVQAAIAMEGRNFSAPFLFSWLGVWVFSLAGGICASFVRIEDIDNKFYAPMFAKIVLGLFSGVALCSLIASGSEPPKAALTFWAFFASLFSAPIGAGALVYLSNQDRLNGWFNRVSRHTIDSRFPIDKDYKRRSQDDTDLR